jgi:hypothetical protein
MSDGSGCAHDAMVKSFIVPTSRECAQCGKPELTVLRVQVDALEQDKRDLIGVIAGLQDIIAKLKHGLKGDYDLDMWLDWVMDKKAMQQRTSPRWRRLSGTTWLMLIWAAHKRN